MSKIKAYRCNYCGEIKEENSIVGIANKQELFDELNAFPVIKDPEKAEIHGCTGCYKYEMREADTINRRKYEALYTQKRKEAGFSFRRQCVINYIRKQFTPPVIIAYKSVL